MAKLVIKTEVIAPKSDVRQLVGNIKLNINAFVPVGFSKDKTKAKDLISQDEPNALTLGSDEKLLANPNPEVSTDFSAYYILARG